VIGVDIGTLDSLIILSAVEFMDQVAVMANAGGPTKQDFEAGQAVESQIGKSEA
jgi:hypothetical protein